MFNNAWFKLAVVSLTGIVISFVVLWGINQFTGTTNSSMNMGNGGQMNGMQMGQQDSMSGMNMQGNMSGMNTTNGINVRESVNIGGGTNVQENVSINPGVMGGTNAYNHRQFGISMMQRMRNNIPFAGIGIR